MFRTFNMGVGMVVVCAPEHQEQIRSHLSSSNQPHFNIGQVTSGNREVSIS